MRRLLIAAIRGYQVVSRLTPRVCRFTPTCSEYAAQALQRYGVLAGGWMAIKRICRCHPWNKGGYDPVGEIDSGTAMRVKPPDAQ